jgi:hypothetical protein
MKKNAPYMLNIDMSSSEDMHICTCKCATSVHNEIVLASMLAGAVVSIAHGHSHNPHKFAETVCGAIMEFIDKPGFTKPSQKLS